MHPLLPALAKAAAVTAVLIVPAELMSSNPDRKFPAAAVISVVAARALGYYLGAGAATGAWIGFLLIMMAKEHAIDKGRDTYTSITPIIMQAALALGALGYVTELAGTLAYTRITAL